MNLLLRKVTKHNILKTRPPKDKLVPSVCSIKEFCKSSESAYFTSHVTRIEKKILNPLTPGSFYQKCIFLTWVKLAPIYSERQLETFTAFLFGHTQKVTYAFGLFVSNFFAFPFFLFLFFLLQWFLGLWVIQLCSMEIQ